MKLVLERNSLGKLHFSHLTVDVQRRGTPCIFSYPSDTATPTDKCIAAAYVKIGSSAEAVIIPLRNTGVGSPNIQFSGSPENVNRALAAIAYKTRPFYNLLYRPPISQRGSLFDMTLDSSDGLIIVADDLGNSGNSCPVLFKLIL